MRFDLNVVYNNSDTGNSDEQVISIETADQTMIFLGTVCESRPTDETFDNLFKKMFDNPTMDGVDRGVLYDEIWPIMSRWAFEKLGWHDVTVDVVGLSVDGEKTKLNSMVEIGMIDNNSWSLQLSRDGFMYCYS